MRAAFVPADRSRRRLAASGSSGEVRRPLLLVPGASVQSVKTTHIRPARVEDAESFREVEVAAGRRFIDVGMPEIAAAEPMEASELMTYAREGRSWAAVDEDDAIV